MGKRKFGKKNVIKINPLMYNTGLIGESGIGKTTLAVRTCEKLVGEDGYLCAQVGKEDGIDAISGAMYVEIPDADVFDEFTQDVINNKEEDYKDLQVIIWDSLDQLIDIFEPEAVRLWNQLQDSEKKPKYAESINGAWGGFGKGEKKVIELIMNRMWELKQVGVYFIIIGHTKKKTLTDVVTGSEYDMLTTNMQNNYFNAFKTKLHFLGVASIDRSIIREKTGKKNIVTGKEEEKGRVIGAERIITFRDDNYSVDSKSRFSDIVPVIPLDVDSFIEALTNAIKAEAAKDKTDKTIEERAEDQKIAEEKRVAEELQKKNSEKEEKRLEEVLDTIDAFFKKWSKAKPVKLTELLKKQKELGVVYNKVNDMESTLEEKLSIAKQLFETIQDK